ncbi:unnamed protein product [Notodromas monacha]|uniref:Class II aldolase/adducin N-terminal domain-containing protein n=1 Tax=Notodromas monacha TaxID=399045 RepID=A0A7R9G8G3_9CRUS|nr:unnamed protein product [Notodromas monacha]CAG0913259.1 unnamed protein product [Notodromas monacha]
MTFHLHLVTFSSLLSLSRDEIFIAPSGVHKERVKPEDLFVVSASSNTILSSPPAEKGLKMSECTPLFMAAYELYFFLFENCDFVSHKKLFDFFRKSTYSMYVYASYAFLYLVRRGKDDLKQQIPEMLASCEGETLRADTKPSAAINSSDDEASQATAKQEEASTPSTGETPQVEPSGINAELRPEESQPLGSIFFTNCTFSSGTYVFKIQKALHELVPKRNGTHPGTGYKWFLQHFVSVDGGRAAGKWAGGTREGPMVCLGTDSNEWAAG